MHDWYSDDADAGEKDFYAQAFSRNRGLITDKEQRILRNSTVAIAGLGGVGGNYCLSLARTGVGGFSIADFDVFETVNINRQAGADMESIGQPKCEVLEKRIRDINPYVRVKAFSEGISADNIDAFLEGADVVLDGLDFFAIDARRLLFRRAREQGIFVITSPPIGYGAALLVFDPKGMTFERYFDIRDGMSERDMLVQFGLGLSPSLIQRRYFRPTSIDFSNKKTPSLGIGAQLCSVLTTCEAIKIIFGKKVRAVPYSTQFDPYMQKYVSVRLWMGNRHPKQRIKKFILKRILMKKGNL